MEQGKPIIKIICEIQLEDEDWFVMTAELSSYLFIFYVHAYELTSLSISVSKM